MEIDLKALIEAFLAEADEHLREMELTLLELEGRPEDPELLQTLFRVAHTFKGSATTVGFARVAEMAHALEDVLARVKDGTLQVSDDLVSLLLEAKDALRRLVAEQAAGRGALARRERVVILRLKALAQAPAPKRMAARAAKGARRRAARGAGMGEAPETAAAPEAAPAADALVRGKTLRIDVGKLDRMLNLAGEIVVARVRVERLIRDVDGGLGQDLLDAHRDSDRLFSLIQELILKARMEPVGPTFRQHIRTVRDLALSLGKKASLVIEGADVEVDTAVLEPLRDALTHMIRNALDHGIEAPELRRANGKREAGTITLRAFHDGGQIVVEVEDDGAGLDRARIVARALQLGIVADPESLTDAEAHDLIFRPGFSTTDEVTGLSGRGVGMDVVHKNLQALRGTVLVDSRPGQGTRLSIRLPLTLALIEGLYVAVGPDTYVVPLDLVQELHNPGAAQLDDVQGVFNLRDRAVPYLHLRRLFGLPAVRVRSAIVVVRLERGLAGLVVDGILGQRETVIKPLSPLLHGLQVVSGSAILSSGRVGLILDVPALLRHVTLRGGGHAPAPPVPATMST